MPRMPMFLRWLVNVVEFYRQGFRSMRLGRTLWAIVLIKLMVLATLTRLLLPDQLKTDFATDRERSAQVLNHLTLSGNNP